MFLLTFLFVGYRIGFATLFEKGQRVLIVPPAGDDSVSDLPLLDILTAGTEAFVDVPSLKRAPTVKRLRSGSRGQDEFREVVPI